MNDIQNFQIFVKPIGAKCNLNCEYCYYFEKSNLYPASVITMDDEILERYIVQHFEAAASSNVVFSWHGGEPTLLGIDYFKKIIQFQQKHKPPNCNIINGIQTNGTLLTDDWCKFFNTYGFTVGVSLDGQEDHNHYRKSITNKSIFQQTLAGIELLKKYGIFSEVLCVVHNKNVEDPIGVYRFLKEIKAEYISFLPLVEKSTIDISGVTKESVNAEKYGVFLCTIFDEWKNHDIGKTKIQIIEETVKTAFNLEHGLCIFRKTCGGVPVIERNGDFYSCDHYVNPNHHVGNINEISIREMLNSQQQISFGQEKWDSLPEFCQNCNIRNMCNGGCPKNRFITIPNDKQELNYLCKGYFKFFNHCQSFVDEIKNAWIANSNNE